MCFCSLRQFASARQTIVLAHEKFKVRRITMRTRKRAKMTRKTKVWSRMRRSNKMRMQMRKKMRKRTRTSRKMRQQWLRQHIEIVITEKLSDGLEGSEKKVYRARVLPHDTSNLMRNNDDFIGGIFKVPRVEIPIGRRKTLEGGMSVVVTIPQSSDHLAQRNLNAMERESRIMQKLHHKNIVGLVLPFQEICVSNHVTKIITQCMIIDAVKPLGFDLFKYTEMFRSSRQIVPPEHIRWFVSQIHAGMIYIHSKGIVHRDLKPDNVLVDSCFHATLIDFGYASAPGMELEAMNMDSPYVAPEVNDAEQTPSIDYWGLGVIVHSFYNDHSDVRAEAARQDRERLWDSKRFCPVTHCVKKLRSGLLMLRRDKRWGRNQIDQWLEFSHRKSCANGPITEVPRTQIFPWLGDVKSAFLLTLRDDFQTSTLGELKLPAMILMIHGPDGINVRPARDTELKAGFKVYFAFQASLSDDVITDIFQKLKIQDALTKARRIGTNAKTCDKIVEVSRAGHIALLVLRPVFDAFCFPDFCAGATLGPDGLNLRGIFEIPIAALVREDGSVLWWPGPGDVVQQGDQGLLTRDFAEELRQTPIITLHMEKVRCLQDEEEFRQKLGLANGEQYGWKTDFQEAQLQAACSMHPKATAPVAAASAVFPAAPPTAPVAPAAPVVQQQFSLPAPSPMTAQAVPGCLSSPKSSSMVPSGRGAKKGFKNARVAPPKTLGGAFKTPMGTEPHTEDGFPDAIEAAQLTVPVAASCSDSSGGEAPDGKLRQDCFATPPRSSVSDSTRTPHSSGRDSTDFFEATPRTPGMVAPAMWPWSVTLDLGTEDAAPSKPSRDILAFPVAATLEGCGFCWAFAPTVLADTPAYTDLCLSTTTELMTAEIFSVQNHRRRHLASSFGLLYSPS